MTPNPWRTILVMAAVLTIAAALILFAINGSQPDLVAP